MMDQEQKDIDAAESRRKRRFSWQRKAAAVPFGGASRPLQLG